jgi:hypothetical protein
VDENLRRVRGLHQEVQAGVSELQLPVVDFDHLQNLLDSVNQENTAQVVDLVDEIWSCVRIALFLTFFICADLSEHPACCLTCSYRRI